MSDPKFWVAASFVIFVVLVGKMAWSRITAMLDGRGARIAAELAEAERLRAEAQALLLQARADREQALADAQDMIARARAEVERLAAQSAAEAATAAQRRERMAMDRIAAAEAAAVADVRAAATDVAITAARAVIAQGFSAEADATLIDRSVAELPKALRAA